ncbi:MAG: ABC transporter ATP-binding protein/permease [Desulfobacteraceae bacterium]|jgi:ABC-type multidrug transport system fused ATPase/permease subunit|nr:ABC transporter ATP-binding protein/permease [Desulfobacteraceae bacterium]
MDPTPTSIVKRSLLSWIFTGNHKLKVLLILTVVVTVFIRVIPLELQKRIVNRAINLKAFDLLLIYCGFYLVAVVIAGALKYLISYLQTVIGQRSLTAMRRELYRHMLSLPLDFFRRTQPGMVVQSFASELATAGDFVGLAVAVPLTSVLSLIAFTVYLIWLNPLLAAVSFAIYPLALFVLPMLQRRANAENIKRVEVSRDFSGKIAEAVSGIHEIQGNAAHHVESRKFDILAYKLEKIRIAWNLYRQGIKVGSNFFTSFSPFIIFLLGGYLTIKGQIELGGLVAFLSAQEKLFDPWRELIDFYQSYQEASVSYRRTMEYFDVLPEFTTEPEGRPPFELEGSLEIKGLSMTAPEGIQLLNDVNLTLDAGEQLALVGFSGSGKSTLAGCIGQLYRYTAGSLLIGKREVAELTKRDMAVNIGLVSQSPFIFDGTIEENLLYGSVSKFGPGHPDIQPVSPDLDQMIETIQQTGLFTDVLRFGLNSVLDVDAHGELIPRFIRIRKKLVRRLGAPLADHVEFFDKEKYLFHSTVAKNLTFGSANLDSFRDPNLSKNTFFLRFLQKVGLNEPLVGLGTQLCRQTVNILGELPPDAAFFEHSPIRGDELPEYKTLAENLKKSSRWPADDGQSPMLLELALRFIPGRHKMVKLPADLERQILTARQLFGKMIPKEHPGAFSFYRKSDYIVSHTILQNLFFGKLKTTRPQIQDTINEQIVQLLIEEDLLETVLEIGLQFQVGTRGDRLSGGQRQKIAIARAFLKDPRILIMDEATSALDNRSQARIQNVLNTHWKGKTTLIAVVHRLDIIKKFNKIGVMKSGKVEEMGSYEELMAQKGLLYELVAPKS